MQSYPFHKRILALLLCVLMSVSCFSFSAQALSQQKTQRLEFSATPSKTAYAAGEEVWINTRLRSVTQDVLRDVTVTMHYTQTDTAAAAGTVSAHFTAIAPGETTAPEFSIAYNDDVARISASLPDVLGRLLRTILHLISQLTPLLQSAESAVDRAKADFKATLSDAFSPHYRDTLGSCAFLYDGQEVTCTFRVRYALGETRPFASVAAVDSADGAFGANLTLGAGEDGKLTGFIWDASVASDGGFTGNCLFLDRKSEEIGVARVGTDGFELYAKKSYALKDKQQLKISFSASDERTVVTVEGDPFPLFDLPLEVTSGEIGFIGAYTDYARTQPLPAVVGETYANPILDNSPDPYILKDGDVYYLYATNASDGFYAYKSADLIHWESVGQVAKTENLVGTYWFWAPEVYHYNDRYYLFYSAEEKLAVAVSDSPEGPFMKTADEYLLDIRAIDGNVLFDDDGKIYLYFSGNSSQGTNKNGIWGCELNADLCSVKADTLTELSIPTGWENAVNEGPFMLKHNGVYYLTYSGEGYGSPNYSVGVMTSDSPLGTFTRDPQNPILHADSFLFGTGHHCFTVSPDGSELLIAYHSHYSTSQVHPRTLCIDRAAFTAGENGIDRLVIYGPTVTPQPVPSK